MEVNASELGETSGILQVNDNMDESLMVMEEPRSQNDDSSDGFDNDDDEESADNDDENAEDDECDADDDDYNNDHFRMEVTEDAEGNRVEKAEKTQAKKRKRSSNQRRNIRKVFRPEQLDAKTLEAQEQEKERLKRIERQRSMHSAEQTASLIGNEIMQNNDEKADSSNLDNSVIILDDEDDSEYSEEEEYNRENIILISSSESEGDSDDNDDDDNHIDDSNELNDSKLFSDLKNDKGEVIVNPNHPTDEPDIFLPTKIADVIKPHQVSGVRFLYDNLIESLKNYKSSEGFGCVLAHSMGLGKTIQTISLVHVFLKYTPAKKVLIIVPINTLQNWLVEFKTWLPETACHTTEGKELCKDENQGSNSESSCERTVDVVEGNQMEEDNKREDKEENIVASKEGLDKNPVHIESSMNGAKKNDDDVTGTKKDISDTKIDENTRQYQFPKTDINCRDYEVFLIGDSQKTTISRAKVVGQWNQDGGVLLMGYEMFRGIAMYTPSLCNSVTNAKGKKKKQKAKKSATVIDIEEEEKEMELFMGMQKALCKPGPDLVVCDEGHRIKNHQSNIHMALHKIKTRKRLVLTGYPLQNNLTEYWCMVDFVRPNYLGTRQEFQNMFERPITNGQCVDSTAADKQLMKYRAHVLSSLLKGFVQRRGYTALKHALPPKQEHVIMVRLSDIQQAVYRRFIELMKEGFGDQLNPIKIFAVCSKIWNHPDILYKAMKADESKQVDLFDTDEDVGPNDKPKPKATKNNTRSNQNATNSAMEEGFNPFGGGEDARALLLKITHWAKEIFDSHSFKEGLAETSGKFVLLLEIIHESLARGDKILVFSQSLMTLDLIEEMLSRTPIADGQHNSNTREAMARTWKKNVDYYRIDGSTPAVERERLIDSFNNKKNTETKLFMLSTRAGCLGINLIGANRVVVFDVSWNPCHDAQAVCRVYRYGQEKPCYIYRLVASNTMEKRMYYRQISKQGVSDRVVDELNPVENFTKEEVNKLLSTTWEEEPEIDYTGEVAKFDDPVLKEICGKCGKLIVMTPFKHESLLEDHEPTKLSKSDKKLAKRAYEEEKRKSSMIYNGAASIRAPYNLQTPMVQIRPAINSAYTPLVPNPALYGQQALYGNQLIRSSADFERLRSIIAHHAAAARQPTMTSSDTHSQASNVTTAEAVQPGLSQAQQYGVANALNSMTPQQLAAISALRNGLFGSFFAPGFPNVMPRVPMNGSLAEQASTIRADDVQTGLQNLPSSSFSGQNDLSSDLSNDSLSRQTNDSVQSRQTTEVICLDSDDEEEAGT